MEDVIHVLLYNSFKFLLWLSIIAVKASSEPILLSVRMPSKSENFKFINKLKKTFKI